MGSSGHAGISKTVTPRHDGCPGYMGQGHRVFFLSTLTSGEESRCGEARERLQPTLLTCVLPRSSPSHGAQQLLSMSKQGARDTTLGKHTGAHLQGN